MPIEEAWVVRSRQRGELARHLLQQAVDEEMSSAHEVGFAPVSFSWRLQASVASYLWAQSTGLEQSVSDDEGARFFNEEILPQITEFSRVEEETNFLVAQFLRGLAARALDEFRNHLMTRDLKDPEITLGAPSLAAMIEVEG